MLYQVSRTWKMTLDERPHDCHLTIQEGFFKDQLALMVDDECVVNVEVGLFSMRGRQHFWVEGQELELVWIWGMTLERAQPESILILRNDEVLFEYKGEDVQPLFNLKPAPNWIWIYVIICFFVPALIFEAPAPLLLGMIATGACYYLSAYTELENEPRVWLCTIVAIGLWFTLLY